MSKYILIALLYFSILNVFAQFNDPLFNLSSSKSSKLKKEKAIADSVSAVWYKTLQEITLNDYKIPNDSMPVFEEAENRAEYDGGTYKLIEYIEKNKSNKSKDSTIILRGLNVVKFIISDKGEILHPQIVYSDCELCDAFTIKLFNDMPRWLPAKQYNTPVYSFGIIPIFYKE